GVGLELRAELVEDRSLDVLLLGRRLDHEIALAEGVVALRRANPLERTLTVVLADGLLADLPRHVTVDGGNAGLDAVGVDIVELHVEARQRTHMRDAAAHLTSADHANFLDAQCHDVRLGLPPVRQQAHPLCPSMFYADPPHCATGDHGRRSRILNGYLPSLPSSCASSGSA